MNARMLPVWISVVLFPVLTLAAPAPADRMLQQEQKQQQLKTTTQRVAGQLNAIIEEFQRNAIEGEDVKVLRAIGGVLGRLSEKDMEKVIAFLQQARASEDPNASTRKATDAYASQKSIIIQLQQLVLEYQRQQALYELSLRFKEYAARQTANMWLGVSLARETEGKALGGFSEPQQSSLRVQQIDQETLKDEIVLTLGKLEQISKDITDGPTSERPKLALQQAQDGALKPSLDAAVEDLKTGKLLSASGNEKRARDQLREIARLLLLSQGELEALRQALHEVEQAIEQQKSLMADTRKIEKDDLQKVQPRQAELVDSTDLIRRDVESLAPIAADQLETAMDRMQEARKTFSDEKDPRKQREKAPPKQEEALTNLENARRTLMEELAKAEQVAATPENALAELKDIQEQVRELIKDEEKLKDETAAAKAKDLPTKAPRQGELKDTAQELQQRASPKSPTAAQSINEAAGQMQKAQNSLASSQNNPAAQQAAIDALQRADQQLSQDIAALEQAQKELAALEEMMQKLQAIIEEQQKVHVGTSKEAVKPEKEPLKDLSGRQEKLGNETGELQKETSVPVPTAATHLGNAQNKMGQAKSELDKPEAGSAQPRQEGALKDLYAAQREFERRMNELRDQLGLAPLDNAQSLADAQSLIEQAQRDVDQALSELQQAPPGLLDTLIQQQQQIASSLGQLSQNSPNSAPLNQAKQSANQAAQNLAQSNLPKAIDSMKAAQNAMKQAGAPPKGADNEASLPAASQQQAEVQQAAESLLNNLQNASKNALQQAERSLENAGQAISPLTTGKFGPLPPNAQSALQSAQDAMADGSAQASGGQGPPAQSSSFSAAKSLAQAQAALALAQAGLGSQMAQGQGQQPGQGQGQGQGQTPGQGQGRGQPPQQGNGRQGNWDGSGGGEGARRNTAGASSYIGLPKRDRAAILQSQSEKYPQEYAPLVEQYLKNLADQSEK